MYLNNGTNLINEKNIYKKAKNMYITMTNLYK